MSNQENNNNNNNNNNTSTDFQPQQSFVAPNDGAQNLSYYIVPDPNVTISSINNPQPGQPVLMQPVVQPGQPIIMQPGQPGQPVIIQPGQPGQPVLMQPVIQPGQPVVLQPGQQLYPAIYPQPPPYQQTEQTSATTTEAATAPENKTKEINNNTVVLVPDTIPRHSVKLYCPYCKKNVTTLIGYDDNIIVWGICILLCLFGVILCCIPFFIKDIKDVVHYCPSCKNEIARNERAKC